MKLNKKLRLIRNYFYVRFFGKKSPFYIQLELTRKCNFKCKYCNIYSNKEAKETLSLEAIKNIIDKVENDCCFINLEGGEPLLRKDLREIIEYIQKKDGIFLSLTTNGSLIKNRINDLKKMDAIGISLDGPEFVQDKHRGKGSFDKVIEAMKIIKDEKILLGVSTVLTKYNINHIKEHLILLRENKVDYVVFSPVSLATNMSEKERQDLLPSKEEWKRGIKKIISYKKRYKKPWIQNSLSGLKYFKNRFPEFLFKKDCFYNKVACYINYIGQMQPCCVLKDFRKDLNVKNLGFFNAFYRNKVRCKSCPISYNLDYKDLINLRNGLISSKQ
jgi:MoaA/NifB/PqqE/SkfB family radical SAM enzyme